MKKPHSPLSRSRPTVVRAQWRTLAWSWQYGSSAPRLLARVVIQQARWSEVVRALMYGESEAMKKPDPAAAAASSAAPAAAPGRFLAALPNLLEHLTVQQWEDGTPRQVGRLFIRAERGMWVADLKEPNLGYLLSVTTPDLDEVFPALEAALSAPVVPWQVDQWAARKSPGKKK